ncbi:MAG TPA: hypothetical protein VK141_03765, partial [Nitrosomonas sp.]|nr:hypothetical protein [Nitrosomonas sp.]
PLQSVRAGYGWQQSKWVELRLCADYAWFDFDDSEGWIYGGKYSKGKRRDLSVYPAIMLFNFAELALGCTYTTQDEVLNVPPLHLDSTPTPASTLDPAVKKIDIYAHFGLGSTIHIAGPVGLSLGLQFRANVPTDISVGCRAGITVGI